MRNTASDAGRVEPPAGPDCLGPDEAMRFLRGRLAGDELARVELHVDRCPACLHYVSALAETSAAYHRTGFAVEPGAATLAPPEAAAAGPAHGDAAADGFERQLLRGESLERYVIDGVLGAGSMGVVYSAYDPKLDRKVALKMVRGGAERHDARERLWREARTMARLNHPNVVAVYDVGVHGGQLFLAMEHVDGVTLRSWLRRESRPAREVLRAFLQAGQGLGAAHAVGVVHRDFKPDNVLVDKRGRVCVTDFGLARSALDPGDEAPAGPPSPGDRPAAPSLGASMTRTGALVGTPAYMAPEQYAGRPADARTDQFSFCVALYEALYRRRPFEGTTWQGLAASVASGKVREPPARAGVSLPVHKALLRGLSVDPQRRFATMAELLAALSYDPAARRRRVLGALGFASAVGAAALAASRAPAAGRPSCAGAERRLEGVWGAGQKDAVRAALLGTGKAFAPDAWRGVERALDGYARDWVAARVDACEATHVRGEQSAELLDRRMACLDDRLKEAGALVEVLSRADGEVAGKAVGASLALAPAASCADRKALSSRGRRPSDPAAAAEVEALRGRLARAKALESAGEYREALAIVPGVVAGAEALGEGALAAKALLLRGVLEEQLGEVKDSAASFTRAAAAADAAGDDDTRARASNRLVFNAGVLQMNAALAPVHNEHAKSAIARLGGNPGLDGLRGAVFASALATQGKVDDALREFRAAQPLLERAFGPESREVQGLLNNFGNVLAQSGDYQAGEATLRRAVELAEAMLGPHHPEVASLLINLGGLLADQMRFGDAERVFERTFAIEEDALGPDAPTLWAHANNLAAALNDLGQHGRALPYARRALALCEKHGADYEDLVFPLVTLGRAHLGLGDPRGAIEHFERALRLPTYPDAASPRADARFSLARALWATGGDRRRARALAAAARDDYRAIATSPLDRHRQREVDQWLARHAPAR